MQKTKIKLQPPFFVFVVMALKSRLDIVLLNKYSEQGSTYTHQGQSLVDEDVDLHRKELRVRQKKGKGI